MRKTLLSIIFVLSASVAVLAQGDPLLFDATRGEERSLTLPDGAVVEYMAWEGIYYVATVEDEEYQYLNFYVPTACAARGDMPILLRNYVGGYMSASARQPSATDATGRALREGYAVCIPGTRGSNATVDSDGETVYTGRAPAALLDLKAVVRYLRHNDAVMAGSAEKIISDGTSAGGALSALLGATGNHPLYASALQAMGAAAERDDIFAAVCYCPITDLDHADMAYEWLYGCTNDGVRALSAEQKALSQALSEAFPAYLNSLQLTTDDGVPLTEDNYLDYVKDFLIASAQHALDEACPLPDSIGVQRYVSPPPALAPPGAPRGIAPPGGPGRGASEYVADIDMPRYLSYVAMTAPLKTPPAFDAQGVLAANATPENRLFGGSDGTSVNFTDFSLRHATGQAGAMLDAALQERVAMMNPMPFIGAAAATTAPHWYIRHGARDRDTSFAIAVNLATKLRNGGYDVNFALPWDRPHSGDYNLNDLFAWLSTLVTP